jgi:hypothetical protein
MILVLFGKYLKVQELTYATLANMYRTVREIMDNGSALFRVFSGFLTSDKTYSNVSNPPRLGIAYLVHCR